MCVTKKSVQIQENDVKKMTLMVHQWGAYI